MTEYVDVTKAFAEFRNSGLTPDILRQIYTAYLTTQGEVPGSSILAALDPEVVTPDDAVPSVVYTWD